MKTPPAYIESSGVLAEGPKFAWKGEGMHFAPDQSTKQKDALAKLTVTAHAALSTCIASWLVYRLQGAIDAERMLQYLDATLAWQVDVRYRDAAALKGSIPKNTPANQALSDGIWMLNVVTEDRLWTHPATAANSSASLISITKQTLSAKPKKAFTSWLDWAIERGIELDPKPKKKRPQHSDFDDKAAYHDATRPYFGKPWPSQAFDPDADFDPSQRAQQMASFLSGLDWKKNPFLRSPADMQKLGFKGKPYTL